MRPMRWWDIEELMGLERELFDDPWAEGLFWSELAQVDSRYYVVVDDVDGIIAYAGLASAAEEGYIQTVAVARDRWGKGLGTTLVGALVTESERRGVTRLVLEVRLDNERAQGLYRSFGFEPVGIRKGYYQPSGADAVVMIRRAS
jgi:ribosomal-protein-alanine N-acetyltransferase